MERLQRLLPSPPLINSHRTDVNYVYPVTVSTVCVFGRVPRHHFDPNVTDVTDVCHVSEEKIQYFTKSFEFFHLFRSEV